MTSVSPARSRVVDALGHITPDRVPFSWGFGPTAEMTNVLQDYFAAKNVSWKRFRALTDDTITVTPDFTGNLPSAETDIWGISRRKTAYKGGHYHEITHHPLADAETTADLDAIAWPSADAYDFSGLGARIDSLNPEHARATKLSIAVCGNPFEIYSWMRGLENAMADLLVNPELVCTTLDRICTFFETMTSRALEECSDLIDILFFADDLGTQNSLLMSRETYRTIVQPFHKRLMKNARKIAPGVAIMYHSDGAVAELIPDLMEAGVDILEAVQTDAAGMDPSYLKDTFGTSLCFHGAISVQSVLPHGNPESVADHCSELVNTLGRDGGYIAAPSHAVQIGTPPENVITMLKTVLGESDFQYAVRNASFDHGP